MPIYKAVEIKQWGSREDPVSGIEIADRPVPTPGAGEVLVRIYLRPINPSDVFSLAGKFAFVSEASLFCSWAPGLQQWPVCGVFGRRCVVSRI
jgi:NADPH:quinone reductase-like Zn-dependent oxidoreductase